MNVTATQSERFKSKYDVYKRQIEISEAALDRISEACNKNLVKIPVDVRAIIADTYAAAIVTRDLIIQLLLEVE